MWRAYAALWRIKTSWNFESDSSALVPAGKKVLWVKNALYDESKEYEYLALDEYILAEQDDQSVFLDRLKNSMQSDARLILKSTSWWIQSVRKFFLGFWSSRTILLPSEQEKLLRDAGFQVVREHKAVLLPFYIPVFTWFINLIGQLPILNMLCVIRYIVFRRLLQAPEEEYTVSVVIPCKNEKGNIERAVKYVPAMGKVTEIIFIEGNSIDGTYEELVRVQKKYPQKNIKIFRQNTKGKKDAVKKGFSHASGDILMILDADLTVEPQALEEFYAALKSGKGEFLNGSRLVYPMEKGAMQWGAYFANHGIGYCLSWLLNQKVKDTLCGTKVFFAKDYQKISTINHIVGDLDPFGDFDLLFGAAYHNLKIVDIPVHYKNRRYGSSQISRYWHVWFLIAMGIRGIREFKLRHRQ